MGYHSSEVLFLLVMASVLEAAIGARYGWRISYYNHGLHYSSYSSSGTSSRSSSTSSSGTTSTYSTGTSSYYGRRGYYDDESYGEGYYHGDDVYFHCTDCSDGYSKNKRGETTFCFFLVIFLLVLVCCISKLLRTDQRLTKHGFDSSKKEELLDEEGPSDPRDPNCQVKPANGRYCTSYLEPRRGRPPSASMCTGENRILFQERQGGWKMIGGGCDADGRYEIRDGFVWKDGKAFWVEVGSGTRVTNSGYFDFASHTFRGTWLADNRRGGDYMEFYHEDLGSPAAGRNDGGLAVSYAPPSVASAVVDASAATNSSVDNETPSSGGEVQAVGVNIDDSPNNGGCVNVPPPLASATTIEPESIDVQSHAPDAIQASTF
jgi:hypothetical protein